MTAPLRRVEKVTYRVMSSLLSSFKTYRWFMTLECGHDIDRPIRYLPQTTGVKRRGFAALWHPPGPDRIPEPPKRARCEYCPPLDSMPAAAADSAR